MHDNTLTRLSGLRMNVKLWKVVHLWWFLLLCIAITIAMGFTLPPNKLRKGPKPLKRPKGHPKLIFKTPNLRFSKPENPKTGVVALRHVHLTKRTPKGHSGVPRRDLLGKRTLRGRLAPHQNMLKLQELIKKTGVFILWRLLTEQEFVLKDRLIILHIETLRIVQSGEDYRKGTSCCCLCFVYAYILKPCYKNPDHYSAFASGYKKDTGCKQFGRTSRHYPYPTRPVVILSPTGCLKQACPTSSTPFPKVNVTTFDSHLRDRGYGHGNGCGRSFDRGCGVGYFCGHSSNNGRQHDYKGNFKGTFYEQKLNNNVKEEKEHDDKEDENICYCYGVKVIRVVLVIHQSILLDSTKNHIKIRRRT
ncbi:hypothetical protein V8G54_025321 [Vigna mungo]|uniref:Uncharacterized protein n=1 Tax=Vigna mungo TaxID=3915 RepID=A0AAQ3N6V2_VIGMU